MLNILDLFSGAGGLTEGFRRPEFNIIAHVEMDRAACATLQVRDAYYILKKLGRLEQYALFLEKKITFEELMKSIKKFQSSIVINQTIGVDTMQEITKQIDYKLNGQRINGVIGGPPCQAYSVIGRKRNESKKKNDERIYLYKYYIQFLQKYKPEFFLFENVRGLLSFKDIDGKNLFEKILLDFKKMQPSYNVSYHLVDSSKYGVPQARKRLIIYGQRCSFTEIAEKSKKIDFFDHLKKLQESAPTTRQLFRDLPTLAAGQVINHYNKTHPTKFVSEHIRTDSLPLTWNLSRPNRQIDLAIYKIAAQKRARGEILKYNDLPSYLKTQHPEGFEDRFKAIPADDVSHTVVAHISKDGHYYIHPDANQNRSITVREAARIQTFPDNFYFMNSRTDAFKQIGNAVPPYLARKLADTILLQEKRFS